MKLSLRALFALLTLLCIYLGWQRHLVNERLAVVKWSQATYGYRNGLPAGAKVVVVREEDEDLSWLRRSFGDTTYHWTCVLPPTDKERNRVFSAFPQAKIYEQNGRHLLPIRAQAN